MELDNFLNRVTPPLKYEPREGRLLVAEPYLSESHFKHSVALIIEHSREKGTLGLVLNHEASLTLNQCVRTSRDMPVFIGGPVSTDRMFFLHTLGDVIPGGEPVLPGLWLGGNFDDAISVIEDNEVDSSMIRFFLGYSGWSPGQLEDELKEHAWAVAPAPANAQALLTDKEDVLYHKVVKSLGKDYSTWKYHPMDPTMN